MRRRRTFGSDSSRSFGGSVTVFSLTNTSIANPTNGIARSGVAFASGRLKAVRSSKLIRLFALRVGMILRTNAQDQCIPRTERSALRKRVTVPCLRECLATSESLSISNKVAMTDTSTGHDFDATNSSRLAQIVYMPHDQLKRTKRSDGANELWFKRVNNHDNTTYTRRIEADFDNILW